MEKFESALKSFFSDRIEDIFLNLKLEDQEYKTSKNFIRDSIAVLEEIIDKLSKKNVLKTYNLLYFILLIHCFHLQIHP